MPDDPDDYEQGDDDDDEDELEDEDVSSTRLLECSALSYTHSLSNTYPFRTTMTAKRKKTTVKATMMMERKKKTTTMKMMMATRTRTSQPTRSKRYSKAASIAFRDQITVH